jgi:CheY-like chemotaxis protein
MKVRRLHKHNQRTLPPNVALVEDDPALRRIIRAYLESDSRINVTLEAATISDAVARMPNDIGLVVLDHILDDDQRGFDAAQAIRSAAPDARIVMCSSTDLLHSVDLSPWVDAFIHKHHLDRLLPTVQVLLGLGRG